MAYIIPEAWARYNGQTKAWSGWHTTYNQSGYSLIARTNDTVGTEDRLCFRFRIDKTVVRKLIFAEYKITNIGDPASRFCVMTYSFDPTQYGQYLPSGETTNLWATGANGRFILPLGDAPNYPLNYTSEYFYGLIYNNSPSGIQTNGIFVQPISLLQDTNPYIEDVELYDPEFSLSPTSVTTEGSFTSTITKRGNRTIRIAVMYGNTELTNYIGASDMVSIPANKSWFTAAGVTSLTSISLSVKLQIQENGAWTTKDTKSLTLNAGDDMRPVIQNVLREIVQPAPLNVNYPNTYVKGISKVRFTATVEAGSNAAITSVVAKSSDGSSVALALDSQTGNYVGVAGPITNATWSVEVTDQRGKNRAISNVGPSTIYSYVLPTISIDKDNTYRCTSAGVQDASGTYFKAKATATVYQQLPDNSIVSFKVNNEPITSGTQSGVIATSATANDSITLTFTATDRAGYSSTAKITLQAGNSNIIIYSRKDDSGEETRIGVGAAPLRTWQSGTINNLIDVSVPTRAFGWNYGYYINGIPAGAFHARVGTGGGESFNKNFIDVDLQVAVAEKNATASFVKPGNDSEWTNAPSELASSNWYGTRFVIANTAGQWAIVVILESAPTPGRIWLRRINTSGTGTWKSLTPT